MIEFTQAQNGKRVSVCFTRRLVVVERESDRTGIRISGQREVLIVNGSYDQVKNDLCKSNPVNWQLP